MGLQGLRHFGHTEISVQLRRIQITVQLLQKQWDGEGCEGGVTGEARSQCTNQVVTADSGSRRRWRGEVDGKVAGHGFKHVLFKWF